MENKKLLVLSDSHGNLSVLKTALNWAKEQIPPKGNMCGTVFLGDGTRDLRPAADATGFYSEWKIVRGNNDYESTIPDSAILEFGGHRFFLCHGHRYSIYGSYQVLVTAARNNDAEAVLFGHAHVPYHKKTNGILLVNPGSCGRPRSRIGSTFAVIDCVEGQPLKVEFFGIGNDGVVDRVKV